MSPSLADVAGTGHSIFDAPVAPKTFTGGGQQAPSFDDFLGQAQAANAPPAEDVPAQPGVPQPPPQRGDDGSRDQERQRGENKTSTVKADQHKPTAAAAASDQPPNDDADATASEAKSTRPDHHPANRKVSKPSDGKPVKDDSKKPADRATVADAGQASANLAAIAAVQTAVPATNGAVAQSKVAGGDGKSSDSETSGSKSAKGAAKSAASPSATKSTPHLPGAQTTQAKAIAADIQAGQQKPASNSTSASAQATNAPPVPATVLAPPAAPAGAATQAIAPDKTGMKLASPAKTVAADKPPVDAAPGSPNTTPSIAPSLPSNTVKPSKSPSTKHGESANGKAATAASSSTTASKAAPAADQTVVAATVADSATEPNIAQPTATASDPAAPTATVLPASTLVSTTAPPSTVPASADSGPAQATPPPLAGSSFAGQLAKTVGGDSGPSSVTSSVDRVRFVQRVARAFQAAGDQGGLVRLRLSPPELGSLQVQISVKQGALSAHIQAETSNAQQALLDNLPDLRDRLAQQDIHIERFDVELMDQSSGGMPQTPQGNPDPNQYSRPSPPARTGMAVASAAVEPAPSLPVVGRGALNVVI